MSCSEFKLCIACIVRCPFSSSSTRVPPAALHRFHFLSNLCSFQTPSQNGRISAGRLSERRKSVQDKMRAMPHRGGGRRYVVAAALLARDGRQPRCQPSRGVLRWAAQSRASIQKTRNTLLTPIFFSSALCDRQATKVGRTAISAICHG